MISSSGAERTSAIFAPLPLVRAGLPVTLMPLALSWSANVVAAWSAGLPTRTPVAGSTPSSTHSDVIVVTWSA